MKNRSLVLTVSLIAMMIVGAAHGAQIASTDYVTKSVGDEADLVWTAIDSINDANTGILATAKSYTDTEITAAMEEVADAIPANVSDLTNDTGFITSASLPTKVSDLTNDTGFITAAQDKDTVYTLPAATADTLGGVMVDTEINSTSTNPVQNKAVSAALDGKLGKDEKAASAATADSATTAETATKDASGNVITATYATKGELSSGLSGKLDTNGSIEIAQVNGLSDALANAGSQLNEAQTAAVNSGITQAKVEAYDAYAGQIASKANASALNDYATNQALTNGLAEKLGKDEKAASAATADSATTAETATKDASGNVITATYATKTELSSGLAEKLGKNEKAASAATADSATTAETATSATQDASGNVITTTYATKAELNGKMDKVTLATVATTGSYNDLLNKPTIPTNNNQLTNGAGYITAASLPGATASVAGIMKWGQIPSGSATSATAATIWVQ